MKKTKEVKKLQTNKMLLSSVVQALSQAAANANNRLHKDYISSYKKFNDEEISYALPRPLAITDMKINFSANVSRADHPLGGDLVLDFTKPSNFQGEIKLQPCDSYPADVSYQDCSGDEYDEDVRDDTPYAAFEEDLSAPQYP
jgi:hypothetical protein